MSYVTIFHRMREIPIGKMIDEINSDAKEGVTVIIDFS